jgi:prephenate dehydrogenase
MKALINSCGLMGGSIAKALVKSDWEVHVMARKPLQFDGISFYTNFAQVPKLDFDIICITSPRGRKYEIYEKMFEIAGKLSTKNTVIVDISSVQSENNRFSLQHTNFVPCHPIAGSEKTGFENSSAELLQGKKCLIIKKNPPEKVRKFWEDCKMVVDNSITSCMEHDRIFAKISHLPQLISFNLPSEENPKYKEFYRLKNSSREIWDEIFLHNRAWILEALSSLPLTFGNNFEECISNSFEAFTTEEEKNYAGTGFKTITFAKNNVDKNINEKAYNTVVEIGANALNFLLSL